MLYSVGSHTDHAQGQASRWAQKMEILQLEAENHVGLFSSHTCSSVNRRDGQERAVRAVEFQLQKQAIAWKHALLG